MTDAAFRHSLSPNEMEVFSSAVSSISIATRSFSHAYGTLSKFTLTTTFVPSIFGATELISLFTLLCEVRTRESVLDTDFENDTRNDFVYSRPARGATMPRMVSTASKTWSYNSTVGVSRIFFLSSESDNAKSDCVTPSGNALPDRKSTRLNSSH